MTGPQKLAQFSYVGFNPDLIVTAKNKSFTILDFKSNRALKYKTKKPLKLVKAVLNNGNNFRKFKFTGGAVGYISYDAIRYWEEIPNQAIDDACFPDIHMGIYNDGVIFDHINKKNFYYFRNKDRYNNLISILKNSYNLGSFSFTKPKVQITKNQFENKIEKIKSYINKGDIFQTVFSKRYDFNLKGDITPFYLTLRKMNPSP